MTGQESRTRTPPSTSGRGATSGAPRTSGRRRYALCGLSNRGLRLFVTPLLGVTDELDTATGDSPYGELVAIVDLDADRVASLNADLAEPIPFYPPEEFDRMVDETMPDVVLVASPDHTHEAYAVAALRRDIDVITEKPLAASCAQVQAILAAERDSKATVRVTHNARYSPRSRQLKELAGSGRLGRITNVELVWNVDEHHGSSYFSRWNRQRDYSGGLSVHKSCHHFDLVQWLIDDVPEQAFAFGGLNYFGSTSPHRPVQPDGGAYSVPEQIEHCPYYRRWYAGGDDIPRVQTASERTSAFGLPYRTQYPPEEPVYIYDEAIDIEDTYSAVVRYRGGASMAYSVNFSAPWEGYRLAISGTHGRIEASTVAFRGAAAPEPGTDSVTFYPIFGERETYPVPPAVGGHDGADPLIQQDLFTEPSAESLRLALTADSRQGAYAVAVGEAVWRSVRDNRPYDVRELLGEFA
jgi:predicted dehydrogenase